MAYIHTCINPAFQHHRFLCFRFSVDGVAIRKFPNGENWGQPYVDKHSMGAYLSIWNGDDWATLGGLVKINWTAAPFIASYQHFKADACHYNGNMTLCMQSKFAQSPPLGPHLNVLEGAKDETDLHSNLQWIEDNFMVYNYCHDRERFPQVPVECVHGHT